MMIRLKTYWVWFRLLMKRTIKKPAFLLLLLIMPLLSVLIDRLGQGESAGTETGIMLEGQEEEMRRKFLTILGEQEGMIRFRLYENEKEMRQDVERGELDCGVFLHEDLWKGLEDGAWQETITLYVTSSSNMTEIVKEKIASIVFTLYSERNYVNYIERSDAFKAEGQDSIADIVSFAQAAYEKHLLDGSTFSFLYQGQENRDGNDSGKRQENVESGGKQQEVWSVSSSFRLRGMLAVCIFLSGLSGLLTDVKDREEKRFLRLAPQTVTTMVNIWIPTVYTSAVTLFTLGVTGHAAFGSIGRPVGGTGGFLWGIGKEIVSLLFYQFLIIVYCSIIRIVLRKQEAIAAAIPLLMLLCIVCCPVWVRLAAYLPLFGVLEKLFPVTYYLLSGNFSGGSACPGI